MALSGAALAEIGAGALLIWAGVENASIVAALRSVVTGRPPQPGGGGEAITPAGGTGAGGAGGYVPQKPPPGAATVAAYQAYAQALLVAHGWPGQWGPFSAIVGEEDSSWNPAARNPSGALGIAQALGHGTTATAGTLGNEYGGFGVPDATAKEANSGNGYAQIEWMCAYIAEKYGDPDNAQAYHLANGSY